MNGVIEDVLGLDGLPSIALLLDGLGPRLRQELTPLLARLPLLHLLTEILKRVDQASEPLVQRALLDLARLAVAKHQATRRLFQNLADVVTAAPSTPPQAALPEVSRNNAQLALEMLTLIAELLAFAGRWPEVPRCFEIEEALCERLGLDHNHAVALYQRGTYLIRAGALAQAETALKEAAARFAPREPSLARTTHELRARVYKAQLLSGSDTLSQEECDALMASSPTARSIVLLAQAQRALEAYDLQQAKALCTKARTGAAARNDLHAELLLIEARLERRRGRFEEADLLRRQAEGLIESEALKRQSAWESYHWARDLKLQDRARELLAHFEEEAEDDAVFLDYQKAVLAFQDGDGATAKALFESCLAGARHDGLRADCHGMLAMLASSSEEGLRALCRAVGVYVRLGRKLDHAITLSHFALVEMLQGSHRLKSGVRLELIHQFHRAGRLLKVAGDMAEELGAESLLLDVRANRARLEMTRGRFNLALRILAEALTHVELVYLTLTDPVRASDYLRQHEGLNAVAIHCALESGRPEDALYFTERSKARRLLRDLGEAAALSAATDAPGPQEEGQILSSIQPIRQKLRQGRPLNVAERQALLRAEHGLTELRRADQDPAAGESPLPFDRPLGAQPMRRVVFGPTAAVAADRLTEYPDEEPREFPGGGVVECLVCRIDNRIESTYCSACETRLAKTCVVNLDVALGGGTEEDVRRAYADHLYNRGLVRFQECALEEADGLFAQALVHAEHPDYFYFHGLCRLAFEDGDVALRSLDRAASSQFTGQYPYWPLPVRPSAFRENVEQLRRDRSRAREVFQGLLEGFREAYGDPKEAKP
jgi:tetratricopeptide (TPR) repeat protein